MSQVREGKSEVLWDYVARDCSMGKNTITNLERVRTLNSEMEFEMTIVEIACFRNSKYSIKRSMFQNFTQPFMHVMFPVQNRFQSIIIDHDFLKNLKSLLPKETNAGS